MKAGKVDAQNAGDPLGEPSSKTATLPPSAPPDLIFMGVEQPSGYTEPLLHEWRRVKKVAR